MSGAECSRMELLLQADHDGELDVAATAELAAHLMGCAACRERQAELAGLSQRLRSDVPAMGASELLRARVAAMGVSRPARVTSRRPVMWGAGLALAASLVLVMVPRGDDGLLDAIAASHIRALQPGHLTDVVSSDHHVVRPWFDGRLDFAPPVKELATVGFPLIGGRLDYLGGRPVAALSYRRGAHVIDLYIWPGEASGSEMRSGYRVLGWSSGGMRLWAVSDAEPGEMEQFRRSWLEMP